MNARESALGSAASEDYANDWECQRRQRIQVGAACIAIVLFGFACHSFFVFGAVRMAGVSISACLLSLIAFFLVRYRQQSSASAHVFISSLYVQIFGEMLLNGGLSAPGTPLVTLIVPAAHLLCPSGSRAVLRWCLVVGISLALIAMLESSGLTLASELNEDARRLDKLLSMVIGVLCATFLTNLFASQSATVMQQLARERRYYRQQALFDSLTGLPNRENFVAYAEQQLQIASAESKPCYLIFLDINQFKQINDTLGHAAGDALLEQVGERLNELASEVFFPARLAGDEFIIIGQTSDSQFGAQQSLNQLKMQFESGFELAGQVRTVSFSAGIAHFPQDGPTLEALMNSADKQMYREKANQTMLTHPETTYLASVHDTARGLVNPA